MTTIERRGPKNEAQHEMKYIASLFREVKDCQHYCKCGVRLPEIHREIQVLVCKLFDTIIQYVPE